jgi:hypothetical protein
MLTVRVDQFLMSGLQRERPEPVSVRDARWQPSPENCQVTITSKMQNSYAAAAQRWLRWCERGPSLDIRSRIGTSRSGSSLFNTYSSTNHRIRPGISLYAESRMIGRLGNRCLIW